MAQDDTDKAARRARRRERRAAAEVAVEANAVEAAPQWLDPAEILGDIDAWGLVDEGDWLRFTARLEDEPRSYLRAKAGGDFLADAPGPLMAILGIGGARRAGFNAGPPRFRYNVLAPADHIGAVGLEGTAPARRTAALQHLRHRSRESLIADHLLGYRRQARRGMPLIVTRVETDGSASLTDLAQGAAFANLLTALDNLSAAAAGLGRKPQVLALTIGFGLEDLTSSAAEYAAGFRALMAKITAEMRVRGMVPPIFLADTESGTARLSDHAAIEAYQELAWCPGPHRLILPTATYAGQQDEFGRLTEAGRETLAELDALALEEALAGRDWSCPLPLLAEYSGSQIRVTFRSMEPLVIDKADPHRAGPTAGFQLVDAPKGCKIKSLRLAEDDPRALILDCSAPPKGARLDHACRLAPQGDGLPINRSAIRDQWSAISATGSQLHRWALPTSLPLHPSPHPKGAKDEL